MVFLVGKLDPLANLLYEKLGREWVRVGVGNSVGMLSKVPVTLGLTVVGGRRTAVISYGAGDAAAGGSGREHQGSTDVLEKENTEIDKWAKGIRKDIDESKMSPKEKEMARKKRFEAQQRQDEGPNTACRERRKLITEEGLGKAADAAKTGIRWWSAGEVGKSLFESCRPSKLFSRIGGGMPCVQSLCKHAI